MRNVELSLESGADLDVRSFDVQETMSAAFRVDVVARSHEDALDLGAITGNAASLRVRGEHGDRVWTGVCARAAQSAVEPTGLSTYTFQLVPALWLLTQRTGYRVFQHLSTPEIVEKLLGEWQIRPRLRLSQRHPKLAMRTQYGESDHDFVRRLLAEAGISFFFHTDDGEPSQLVLSDAPETAEPLPGGPVRFAADSGMARGMPHVSDVDVSSRVVAARATFRDHDFRRPWHAVTGTHAAPGSAEASPHALLEDYRYAPGHSLAQASSAAGEPMADSLGTYRHQDLLAAARATLHAEALRAGQTRIAFVTTRHDLAPGAIFSVEGHPRPEVAPGKKLLVTHAWIHGDVGAAGWHAGGRAVPADRPFRPVVDQGDDAGPLPDPFEPLRHTAKPRIVGVESAVVTGPRGQEVHTDEHGRVTVQFPWDREGKLDEKSSPWVRVSQAWAGPGYGVHTLPRVGHEVLVAFHGGDPDHPVVVGRVHDATGPVPYALPEHKMRTSIRTSADTGANEITFDDAKGQVLFYMQAAEDLHKVVERDELELTQGSRSLHVDGDLTISGGGTVTFLAGKDIVVKGGPNVFLNPKEPPAPGKKPTPLTKAKKPPAKHAPAPAPHGGISAQGRAEMAALERVAAGYAGNRKPGGWCLKKVEDYLQDVTYGKIGHGNIPRFEYAHDFADYLNAGDRYKSLGLQKLPITNPYDAPEGSIIVVRAGTPGTANPVAGDIVVKGPGDHFYNDGEMGYGGPENFPRGNNYVLGIYAPQ